MSAAQLSVPRRPVEHPEGQHHQAAAGEERRGAGGLLPAAEACALATLPDAVVHKPEGCCKRVQYNVLGTLQDQLTYPNTSNSEQLTPEDLTDILRQVDLEYLVSRDGVLDSEINWEEELSLGEAQRLAIARLIRARPAFAILDVSGAKRPASALLSTQSAAFAFAGVHVRGQHGDGEPVVQNRERPQHLLVRPPTPLSCWVSTTVLTSCCFTASRSAIARRCRRITIRCWPSATGSKGSA